MQHMVVYGSSDGKASYFQAEDLDGAVRFVEHLVNVENVTDSRIFELREVPMEFKAYYRVEVKPNVGHRSAGKGAGKPVVDVVPSEPVAPAAPAAEEPVAPVDEEPTAVPAASASGRFGLFSRG